MGKRSRAKMGIFKKALLGTLLFLSFSGFRALAEEAPRLAILPFFVERSSSPALESVCPFCGGVRRKGNVPSDAVRTLTRFLYQKMEEKRAFRILPLEKIEATYADQDERRFQENPASSSIQLGGELQSDFVLAGYLFRFEERIGSSVGVEKPASVGFDLHLYRVRDGKEVWRAEFDETQQPLSADLLKIRSFLRRRAQWLKAEELARVGLDEILTRLPEPKELEEGR